MSFKHKFFLLDTVTNKKIELATCVDEMTANFLSDHFRSVYEKRNDLEVIVQFGTKKTIIKN